MAFLLLGIFTLLSVVGLGQLHYQLDLANQSSAFGTNNSYTAKTGTVSGVTWYANAGSAQNASALWLGTNNITNYNSLTKLNTGLNGRGGAIASALGVLDNINGYYALVATNAISNVDTIKVKAAAIGNTTPATMWVLYTTDSGTTYNVLASAAAPGTTEQVFVAPATIPSAQYAFVWYSASAGTYRTPYFRFIKAVAPAVDPEITLADNGTQIGAGNIEQNTTNNVIATYTLSAAEANASLTEAYFATSGNYTASDIAAIKLWSNSTNSFGNATQLGSYTTTSNGSGDLVEYTGLSYNIPDGATRYFWLTADVATSAVIARNISVDAMIGADFEFAAGSATGAASAGGLKTIVASTAPVLTVTNQANLSFGNVCAGSNSATNGTFDVNGINLVGSTVSVGPLAGYSFSTDGVNFTSSLSIGVVSGAVNEDVFVRFNPAAAGTANGNIPVSSTGASTINVAVTGTGVAAPSISAQPTVQTAVVGNTATFSVTAAGASSYQWQVNTGSGWNNVSTGTGGTTASYTTENTLLGMNGYQYRVQITGTCGTTTSNEVALTVTTAVVYELITSQVELVEGYYVIMNEASTVALSTGYNGTNPNGFFIQTTVTPVNDEVINPNANVVWYIAPNGGGYTIHSSTLDAYLHYSGSSNALGHASTVAGNNERWTFQYSASGSSDKWTVKNMAVTDRQLSYNSGTPRFACYTNANQQELQLYRLAAPVEPAPAIALTQGATAIASGTGTYAFGNQQVSISSAPVIFTITNSGTAQLDIDAITLSGLQADQFSVSAAASSTVAEAGTTTFTVTFTPTSTGAKSATVTIESNTDEDYTFTVTGNGVYSTSSDIIEVSGFTYTSNIPYLSYQNAPTSNTTGNVGVFQFQVRDGGGANDNDALPTTLNEITFAYTGTANTVAAAGLFQGNTHVANGAVTGNNISFTGLNIEAADNNVSANYTLRVSFGTIATDNEQLQFTVQSAVAAGTGSSFASANAGAATSSTTGDRNRMEVVANHISFLQQPVNTSVDMNMSPNPTVQAVDVNNNRDLDFTGNISITSSGTLSASPQTATATLGVASFNAINHTAAGPGFVLTANSSLGNAVSNPFDITTIVYTNGDYRTLGSSTWISNVVSSNWERLVSGVWTPSNSPSYNSTNTIFIQNGHTVTTGGSWGSVDQKIRIMDGGMLTVGHAGTVMNMTVHSGAVLNVNGALTISGGNLEIENNATLNYNHTGSTSTSLFAGTEIFHPNSNFVVKGISNVSNTIVNTNLTTSTFDGHSALFGNFIIDIASPAGNTDLFPGTATTYNLTHQDFIVRNFGSNSFRFATTGSITFNVGRNFIVESTVAAPVQFKTSGSLVMNIAGDMLLQGGNTRLMATSNAGATTTVNLEGNLVMTGNALLEYNNTSTGNQVDVTLNIKGDVDVAATALVRSSNGNGSNYGFFNFVGTGDGLTEATTQTVSIATTVANENGNIRFTVANGAYVRLAGQNLDLGPRGSMNVSTGGTLDFGFNGTTALNVYGVGQTGSTFTSQQGATLKITSPWGLNVAMSGMMGNVSTNTIPTVNTLATFHYIGKENQMTGDVIVNSTLTSNGKIVIVELENNSFTLTPSSFGYIGISNGTALDTQGGRMEIRKGIFLETPNVQVAGSGRLVMTDGTFRTSVLETQLPQLSNHANYSLTGGTVELNGSGNQILKGSPAGGYYNVAVTNAGNKTISSGFSIANNLLITDGVLDVGTVTVNGAGGLTMTGGRFRLGRLSASLPELAGTATPYNLTGGTVELYGTSSTQTHSLRGTYGSPSANISYYNVELTSVGGNVGAGGANVVASAGFGVQGTMTVFAPTCFQLAYNLTITGTGTFDLQADAALKYGGTITASGNTGNIRTAVRNFPTTASYGFVGFVNAQQAGDGLPAQVVNLYLDKNVYNQQVQTANNVSVTGTLRFYNGVVNTGENKVTIEQGGSVVGAGISNGWVHGTLEKFIATSATTANYEVGFSGYSPVSVGLQSVTEGGYMSWRARTLDHPQLATSGILNPDKSINRYWTVGLNDISLTSYSPTFTFLNGDKDAGINTAGVGIGLYNGSWNVMYVGTRAANSTQALNAMLIGDFAIAEAFDMVIPPANDNAQSNNPNFNLGTYVYPSCINVQGTTTNATVHPATGKRDVWYQFVAKSNGVTIRVSSSVIDPRIYLFDANNLSTPLDVEDLIVGTGAEVLNYGNLVEGQSYRIAVASNSANDGIFNICVGHLRIPTCNVTAERTLCELLHTGVTGAHSTVFNFTDVATSATSSYTSSTNNMTLSSPSAQLRHGATYAISNTAIYNLQNGLGTTETISVSNGGGCTLVIAPHRLLEVKANQRCANSAVLTRAANLNADYFGAGGMCGHNGFVVEFTPVANCAGDDPQVLDAFTKSVSVTTPYISLNYAFNHLPLAENSAIGYWSVRWKPRYATYQGVFGPAHVIAVNGTAPAPAFATAPAQEPISAVEVAGGNISSNIYPNPNNGDVMNINLTGVTSSEVFVRIMDSMGREVYTNRYSVDGSLNTMVSFSKPLAQGVYMVEFTAGTEVITQRMMVTK